VLAQYGKQSLYPYPDGTGRDTYINFNNGGNTIMYQPNAKNITNGAMKKTASSYALMDAQSSHSPPRTIHYDTDGTGRDTYILHCDGGFHNQYPYQAAGERHVNSLRQYSSSVQKVLSDINRRSKRTDIFSDKKDHFVEGQCSIRSPLLRKSIQQQSQYQLSQANRLASPKRVNDSPFKLYSAIHLKKHSQVPIRIGE